MIVCTYQQDSCYKTSQPRAFEAYPSPRKPRAPGARPDSGQAESGPKEGGVCGGNLSGFPLRDFNHPARRRQPPSGPKARKVAPHQNKKTRRSVLFVLVGEGGFEPPKSVTTDLQSAPFDRSGNFPFFSSEEVSFRRAFQTKAPSSSPIPLSRVPKLIRPSSFPLLQPRTSPALSLGPLASAFRADGGIRTPDQLITNQLLWPTELHRQNQPFWIAKVGIKN